MDTFDLVPHVRDLAIAYGLAVPIGRRLSPSLRIRRSGVSRPHRCYLAPAKSVKGQNRSMVSRV